MSASAPVRVPVDLGARAYDILVGPGLLAEAGRHMAAVMPKKRAVVVTDETVARLHLAALEAALDASGIAHAHIVVPAGEKTKDFTHLERLIDDLLDMRVERSTMLVALGGGVVGDLTGFAAAIALRGLDYVQIPTTLLSQVDSSVGGKTAINTRRGKNLVGAFHQPRLVLADTALLATLPRRELLAGHAEVIKYGLIDDPDFFAWLEANQARMLAGDADALVHAVVASCRAKARIVAADERESGARALLNLGHTFGHALEVAIGYGDALLHGEAVAIGMVLAFDLSARLGLCPPEDAARVRRHLHAVGLPVAPPARLGNRGAQLVELMGQDKKVHDGRITFVLARGIGRAFMARDVDTGVVRDLLDHALAA